MTGCWKHHHALHHWTENGNLSSYHLLRFLAFYPIDCTPNILDNSKRNNFLSDNFVNLEFSAYSGNADPLSGKMRMNNKDIILKF